MDSPINQNSWSWRELFGLKKEWTPRQNPRAVSSSANVNPLDDLIRVTTTGGDVIMTLETAVGCDGRRHTFKKLVAGNNMIVACTGSETIDGAATSSTGTQWAVLRVISNGTTWDVI